eukprot:CAMPEP_0206438472 /NCGR_PEP_ID=MMETSP0324_2-20121206/11649_1 /ASSEMBLY_ACC=CAM_ASM_000836 /TAXON_ID=2866 /ORGANISM="Crypthecodinium cohnii, Strain Seligo" /LENGTH=396 /DNA_ID=CAMNT_0053905935 /DNA_START=1 /DNA_END=1191 /DNA_ORIENTATION=-
MKPLAQIQFLAIVLLVGLQSPRCAVASSIVLAEGPFNDSAVEDTSLLQVKAHEGSQLTPPKTSEYVPVISTCGTDGSDWNDLVACPQSGCFGDSSCCRETGQCLYIEESFCLKANRCTTGECGADFPTASESDHFNLHVKDSGDGCECYVLENDCRRSEQPFCWGYTRCDVNQEEGRCHETGMCDAEGDRGSAPVGSFCVFDGTSLDWHFCPTEKPFFNKEKGATSDESPTESSTCGGSGSGWNSLAICPQSECFGDSGCCEATGQCLSLDNTTCQKAQTCSGDRCASGFPPAAAAAELHSHDSFQGDGCECVPLLSDCDPSRDQFCWGSTFCDPSNPKGSCHTSGKCVGAENEIAQAVVEVGSFCIVEGGPSTSWYFCPSEMQATDGAVIKSETM